MTITDQFQQAADKATNASEIAHDWANGDENTEIPTESGSLPSVKKYMKDNTTDIVAARDEALSAKNDAEVAADRAEAVGINKTGVSQYSKVIKSVNNFYWGGQGINILGDSISHGAFSIDIFRDNWTNILKRSLNVEFSHESYGFVNLNDALGTGSLLSQEIHQAVRGADFSYLNGTDASFSISGGAYQANTTGAVFTVDVPTFQKKFGVWYYRVDGGGSFDIEVNGTVVASVNTDAAGGAVGGYFLKDDLDLVDNGKGICNIRLITTNSQPVTLIGMSYEQEINSFQVNNFSNSGRRLAHVNEDVILRSIAGCQYLVMSLGHNDKNDVETDPSYYADVQQRIDWLIQYANQYGVTVVVPDFCWNLDSSSKMRTELKRLADSVDNGIYIPFPDYFKADNTTATTTELINDYGFLADSSHPTVFGHQIIGETICKAMDLSVSSKKELVSYHDYWMPIKFDSSSVLKNVFNTYDLISKFKQNGDSVSIELAVEHETTSPFPTGNFLLASGLSDHLANNVYKKFAVEFDLTTLTPTYGVEQKGDGSIYVIRNSEGGGDGSLLCGFCIPTKTVY